ncbi:unnamed protein product, partial [Polarella glacialis]
AAFAFADPLPEYLFIFLKKSKFNRIFVIFSVFFVPQQEMSVVVVAVVVGVVVAVVVAGVVAVVVGGVVAVVVGGVVAVVVGGVVAVVVGGVVVVV